MIKRWQQLGKAFDKNADKIDQCYQSPETELDLEKISPSWQFLIEHGFVLGNLHTGYSASSLLLQLGDILSLANNQQTQAPDVSEWLENLRRLIKRYHLAKSENNEMDQVTIKREIYSNILFMQTTLDGEVSQLEYFIDNKFGHVNSIKAKQEENQYCIDRASRSADKLTIINESEISLLCGNDMELLHIFLRKLLPSVKQCRDRLLAAIPRLKNILWEYRRIDQQTHLVQVLHNYCQNGTGFSADTLSDRQMIDSPFNHVSALTIVSFADVLDRKQRHDLITIVKHMRLNSYTRTDEEDNLTEDKETHVSKDENQRADIPEPLLKPYLVLFIKALKENQQSARKFWVQQNVEIVPTGVWVWWLHLQLQLLKNTKLKISPCIEPTTTISANCMITDILVDLTGREK
jgi:hypothetical protein